jgi:hypothetical protein
MAPSLADLINDGQKDNLFEQVIKEGCIICHFDDSTLPDPKDKFIIITSSNGDDVLVVYINTLINLNFAPGAKEQNLHIPIRQQEYPNFLKHNSYIDCCNPTEKKLSELRKEVSNSPSRNKGEVSTELFNLIISKIEVSHTIEPKIKKKYGIKDKSERFDFGI